MSKLLNETKVLLTNVRLSYPNLFEPRGFEGQEPKYSASLIIPKDDKESLQVIKQAIENAKKKGLEDGIWKGNKIPANLRLPLRDGDTDRPEDGAYANSYFINANSKLPPAVVGKYLDKSTGKAITLGEDEVYAGCYVNVTLNFYPYNTAGNSGIAAGLGNVQKEADGEPLGSITPAEADFEFEGVDPDDDFLL